MTPTPTPTALSSSSTYTELDRKAVLAHYAARLGLAGDPGQLQVPEQVRIGTSRSFSFERWEQELCRDAAEAEVDIELVYQGVASRLACLSWLARLEDPATATLLELPDKVREMVGEIAVTLAVHAELQRAVNRAVLAGRLEMAKDLTRFRRKLGNLLGEVKQAIGAQNHESAESWARKLAAPARGFERRRRPADPSAGLPALPAAPATPVLRPAEPEDDRPVQATFTRRSHVGVRMLETQAPPRASGRARLLLMFFGLCALTYAIQLIVTEQRPEIPVLAAPDFESLELIRGIKARPPSLFMTVDARNWKGLGQAQQRETLDHFAVVAATAGYQGIHVTDTDGNAVGQWLKRRGVELVSALPAPPPG